ncbi:hypothetical protein L1887_56234 [Cichorium endivia]|nr:hypothetical protein L1887_56234 [Cichorium endivia]
MAAADMPVYLLHCKWRWLQDGRLADLDGRAAEQVASPLRPHEHCTSCAMIQSARGRLPAAQNQRRRQGGKMIWLKPRAQQPTLLPPPRPSPTRSSRDLEASTPPWTPCKPHTNAALGHGTAPAQSDDAHGSATAPMM